MIVDAFDGFLSEPKSNVPIQFLANQVSIGTVYTNSTGKAVLSWIPVGNIVYNVIAEYSGDAIYDAASANLTLDLRISTDLRLWLKLAPWSFLSEPSLDGNVDRFGASYPPANSGVSYTTYTRIRVGQNRQYLQGNQFYYSVYRGYVSFDTSALPDDANVISAVLKLKTQDDLTIFGTDFVVQVLGGSQPIYGSSLDAVDWGTGTVLVGQWDTANYVDEIYIQISISAPQINLGGRTQFELKTSREGTEPASEEMVDFYSSNAGGNEPSLEVTYELQRAENDTLNVNTYVDYEFRVDDLPANSVGESVKVYVDDSLKTTVQVTGRAGVPVAFFSWSAVSAGVHYINVSYGGNQNYKRDSFCFAAIAKASPVSLEFSVSDTSFAPGDLVTLRARTIDPLTGQLLSGVNIEFWQDGYGYGTLVNGRYYPTENGVATTNWMYPSVGGAHTIIAKVQDDQPVANVTLAIQPVTLSVGVETRLWLWVERGLTNTDHTVYARLVRANDSSPLPSGQLIKLDVSGAPYMLTTNSSGHATQPLNLVAVGGQSTTYQVRAVFEGAGFKTSNLTIPDPYGRDYLVCTTMQWDFKSSQNSVTLIVEAPKTDTTVSEPASPEDNVTVTQTPETTTVTVPPPKTPEQIQAEAEQNGWLQIWPEFSWSYPWFRLHVKISINPTIEVAFNPVLPGGEWWNWTTAGLQLFAEVTEEIWQDIILDLVGVFISYATAKALSFGSIAVGLIAEGVKAAFQYGFLWASWNDMSKMLAMSLANFIMGLVALFTSIGEAFVKTLFSIMLAPAYSAVILATTRIISFAAPLQILRTPVDYVESIFVDFPIAILALARYLGKL